MCCEDGMQCSHQVLDLSSPPLQLGVARLFLNGTATLSSDGANMEIVMFWKCDSVGFARQYARKPRMTSRMFSTGVPVIMSCHSSHSTLPNTYL